VIVFWGAFEQAGGLMNIYALEKTDRSLPFSLPLIGSEVPASWFQSLNALFIIIFGVIVANFWAKRKLKSKEASSIFKMAIGVIIMGLGFVFMVFASMEFQSDGASAMYWLVLAYLFHTIGELSSSPVALSFITKLAPVKYASLMMGVYFAATGLGNKVAGIVGEFSSEAGDQTVFLGITIFTVAFATIVLLMLKPLKRLTHGVEDQERDLPQQENYELGDEDIVDKEEYKRKK
jgi:POT family proton-dependent oligopeptide transporter